MAECQERKILEGRCRADLEVYLSAVNNLGTLLATQEFHQAYENAELAKRAYEQAREALDLHMAVHECFFPA